MTDLNPCPCGKSPKKLGITAGSCHGYAAVNGGCCGEWEIEFSTRGSGIESDWCMELATTAWNEAPRGGK